MKRCEVVKVVEGLLEYLKPIKSEDIPNSCGACGTPAASCDTDCMDAAYASKYNYVLYRAKELVDRVNNLCICGMEKDSLYVPEEHQPIRQRCVWKLTRVRNDS